MPKYFQAYADTFGGGNFSVYTVDDFGFFVAVENFYAIAEAAYMACCECCESLK